MSRHVRQLDLDFGELEDDLRLQEQLSSTRKEVRAPTVRLVEYSAFPRVSSKQRLRMGFTRDEARRFKRDGPGGESSRPKSYTYRFKPVERDYSFTLTFKRPEVERKELISALQEVLQELIEGPEDGSSGKAEAGVRRGGPGRSPRGAEPTA